MNGTAGMVLLGTVGLILLRGVMTGCDVYGAFQRGAARGMRAAAELLPALCGMLLMLSLLNASGASQLIARLLSPMTGLLHLPETIVPMLVLRPLTGSGSLAVLEQVFVTYGPDSREGMIASVLMGASETILYTMTVYLGASGVKRLPGVMAASLAAYLAGVICCCMIVS